MIIMSFVRFETLLVHVKSHERLLEHMSSGARTILGPSPVFMLFLDGWNIGW